MWTTKNNGDGTPPPPPVIMDYGGSPSRLALGSGRAHEFTEDSVFEKSQRLVELTIAAATSGTRDVLRNSSSRGRLQRCSPPEVGWVKLTRMVRARLLMDLRHVEVLCGIIGVRGFSADGLAKLALSSTVEVISYSSPFSSIQSLVLVDAGA
ncbi:hypothetical protein V6N13_024155 [Hibiscus sabdariffa]